MILSLPHDFAPDDFAFEEFLNGRAPKQRFSFSGLRGLSVLLFKPFLHSAFA
jgi:hypothetical protein